MVRIMNYTGPNDMNIFDVSMICTLIFAHILPAKYLEMSRDIISKGFQRQSVRKFLLHFPKHIVPEGQAFGRLLGN